jgi:hypothetical protein
MRKYEPIRVYPTPNKEKRKDPGGSKHPDIYKIVAICCATSYFFSIRGGSRKAIAKKSTPRARVKTKM